MKVLYEEVCFLISFKHETPGQEKKKGYRETSCQIHKLLGKDKELISDGLATCGLSDQFQKEVGRKKSLTRALSKYKKDFRLVVWNAYFNRIPKS